MSNKTKSKAAARTRRKYHIRKKILQRQDRERLLLFLNKSGESILQENGEPNEKFVDWRKVQTFVWQSYRKSSPI